MADNILGKVWNLDTVAGLVTSDPVNIHSIRVRFTTAGVGSCVLATLSSADVILNLQTTAANTAAVWDTTLQYLFGNQIFQGLRKVALVNVDTIQIVTGISD